MHSRTRNDFVADDVIKMQSSTSAVPEILFTADGLERFGDIDCRAAEVGLECGQIKLRAVQVCWHLQA